MIFNSSAQTERYSIIDKSGFKYEFPLRASPGEIVYSGKNISPGISDSFYLLEDGSSVDYSFGQGKMYFVMPKGNVLIAGDYPW